MTFTIPNLLSLLRMGLIPLFVIMVMNGDAPKALLIFVVAGVTDALDGFIARFWKQQSLLGAYLDPMADKLLLTTAYVVLSIPSLNHGGAQIPPWMTILVIARDVLIVVVALVLYLAAGVRKFPPSVLSKINTILQVVAVALVLVSGAFPSLRLDRADGRHHALPGRRPHGRLRALLRLPLYLPRHPAGKAKGTAGTQRQQRRKNGVKLVFLFLLSLSLPSLVPLLPPQLSSQPRLIPSWGTTMSDFVHLHLHSQFSLLDGANRLDDVIKAAVEAACPLLP